MGAESIVMGPPELPRPRWDSWDAPFAFFTGKGGVGRMTLASAAAVALADGGAPVLLVSADSASNLADVFETPIAAVARPVADVPRLDEMNPSISAERLV